VNSGTLHYSVLLNESIELLKIKADGVYVDGTFGRGGHSKRMLECLGSNGRLIAFDKDIEAIQYAKHNINDERFYTIHGSFAQLTQYLKDNQIDKIDGLLLDLGVSSPQFDTQERGFSFRFDAPLDMRMNQTAGITLAQWLNQATEKEIDDVLHRYGEERFHQRIAANIVKTRQTKPLATTADLVKILDESILFKEREKHFATRAFQAFRILINDELKDLETLLQDIPDYLAVNGRVVVISFHSLEDRIVKERFNQLSTPVKVPKWVNIMPEEASFKVIAKKIRASALELQENTRSRSAILRCLERLK